MLQVPPLLFVSVQPIKKTTDFCIGVINVFYEFETLVTVFVSAHVNKKYFVCMHIILNCFNNIY